MMAGAVLVGSCFTILLPRDRSEDCFHFSDRTLHIISAIAFTQLGCKKKHLKKGAEYKHEDLKFSIEFLITSLTLGSVSIAIARSHSRTRQRRD